MEPKKPVEKKKKGGLVPELMRPVNRFNTDTFGPSTSMNNIFIPEGSGPEVLKHEGRHGEQWAVPGAMMMTLLERLYPYGKGPMERDAYRHEQPTHELLRGENLPGWYNAPRRLYRDAAEAYLKGMLGGPSSKDGTTR